MNTKPFRRLLAGVALLAGTVAFAAGPAAAATPNTDSHAVEVDAYDFGYTIHGSQPLQAGIVTVRLHNIGTEPHQATVARLHDGVTLNQFNTALRQGPDAALALVDFVGGVNTIAPHATASSSSRLSAGTYLVLCFVQGTDGIPHIAKGMVTTFQVAGPSQGRAPRTAGTVRLRSYAFDLPARFGHGTYTVTNTAEEPHELTILRVAPGRSAADVKAYLLATSPAGPPPFSPDGGVGALSPGHRAYGDIRLATGDYVAVCFVPDDTTHMPHVMMGMFQPFHVS